MSRSATFDSSGVAEALEPLRLTLRGGGCDGRTVTVRSETCVVGSGDDCNLRLGPSAPEYVCELIRRADETTVRSRCVSALLNGEAFDEAALRPGDRLSVGQIDIVVEDERTSLEQARKARRTAARADARRSARWDGALLVGELRRLQQELRAATGRQASSAESRESEIEQESQLADSLRTLLQAERAETERLNERLAASYRDREELDRRAAELEEALRQASEQLTAAADERDRLETEQRDADREQDDAKRAEMDSLRGMLGDAQDELEQMRRVYEARLQRAEEIAEEQRLAAVTRAMAEAEERISAERSRLEELESQRFVAAESRSVALEEQAKDLLARLGTLEREAEERLAAAVETATTETEIRVRSELAANAGADLASERARLEEEQSNFREMQRRWDEERAEYERLAMEQTALIAEKQRELRDAYDRLAAAERAAELTNQTQAEPASEQSYIDVDRQAWEEEKAAFEELARSRMEELAEKTRLVEERLRAAAERQRQEIQQEREALAREREEALRDAPRRHGGLGDYLESDGNSESDEEELAEPTFEATSDVEASPSWTENDAPSTEEPRRSDGFRFFGDLSDLDEPVGEKTPSESDASDDRDSVDPVEAERLRQIAEDRLARFAPRPDRTDEEPTAEIEDSYDRDEETSAEAPASGFLLRNFLDADESESAGSVDAYDDSPESSSSKRDEDRSGSVAELLARMGHTIDESDELSADLVEDAPSYAPEDRPFAPAFASRSFDEPEPVEPQPAFAATGGEQDEDSIDDYMQSLLRRVRGESAVQLTQPVQDVRRTTLLRAPEPEPEAPVEEVPVAPLTESEFTPRSEAPEQSDKLSAMRELAIESTRSAIFSSIVRRTYGKTATAGALSAAAAIVGVLALWFGAQGNLLVVGAGLLAWVGSAAWGYRAWKSLKELRRLSAPLKKK